MNTVKTTPEYQIGPFPWKATIHDHLDNIGISDASGSHSRATLVYNGILADWAIKDAEAITKAVNGTYGAGINPEVVKDLFDALKDIYDLADFGFCAHCAANRSKKELAAHARTLNAAKAAIYKAKL